MQVFVLGAGGYIGHHVAKALRREGYRVYGLLRNKQQGAELAKFEVIPVYGDISDLKSYSKYLDQCLNIVDAAGLTDFALNEKIRNYVGESSKRLGMKKKIRLDQWDYDLWPQSWEDFGRVMCSESAE